MQQKILQKSKKVFQPFKQFNKMIYLLLAAHFLASMARFGTIPFIAVFLHNAHGYSASEAAVIIALSPLASMLFGIPSGWMSDRIGLKKMYPVSLLIIAISLSLYGLAQSYILFCLIATLSGIGFAISNVSNKALFVTNIEEHQRTVALSWHYWVFNFGGAVGPLIAIYLVNAGESAFSLHFFASLMFFTFLGSFLLFRNSKASGDERKKQEKTESTEFAKKRLNKQPVFVLFKNKALLLMASSYFFIFFLPAQLDATIPIYLDDKFTDGIQLFGNLLILNTVLIIVGQPFISILLRKLNSTSVITIGSMAFTASPAFFLIGDTPLYWYIGIVLMTIGEMFIAPTMETLTAAIAKKGYEATYFSVVMMGGNLSFVAAPLIGGVILDYLPAPFLFIASIVTCLATGLFLLLTDMSTKKQHGRRANTPSLVIKATSQKKM
ncbi:MFS transporter [Salipaludibacillus sp. LMS25]|jgi:MFS family permease|uniref:MDR family MFS transporter n=1 Tax=Salipaludibacillus sp. LMS25 TaxID=2924031 RepID=UPI0020D017E4|nr:MFS transporter [Salipaludibacillus sp. LMS25]UTR13604.1 MFS transporter [Salipaludibacillus sp. LMS25]